MNNMLITRRIGSTNFKVKIYVAETGTETMEDKILRIIQNHPLANGENCGTINIPQMSRSA